MPLQIPSELSPLSFGLNGSMLTLSGSLDGGVGFDTTPAVFDANVVNE